MKRSSSRVEITLFIYINLLCLLIITFTFAAIRTSFEHVVKGDMLQQARKIENLTRGNRNLKSLFDINSRFAREIMKNRNIRIIPKQSPEYEKLKKTFGKVKEFDPKTPEDSIFKKDDRFLLYTTFKSEGREHVITIWSDQFKVPLIPLPIIILLMTIVNIANFFVVIFLRKNISQHKEDDIEKQEIASNIAHELKNPLAGISLFAELLERKIDSEPEKEYIQNIRKQVRNLNKIISNFINFARPFSLNLQNIRISDITEKIINELKYDLNDISIKIDSKEKKGLRGDPVLLKQVFHNMILNSIEAFEDEKNKYIKININENNSYTVFEIENNGPAIEQNDLEKIFKPYFTSKIKGSGLGLAISKKIVKKHNGTIELISSSDDKTIFKIKIWRKL